MHKINKIMSASEYHEKKLHFESENDLCKEIPLQIYFVLGIFYKTKWICIDILRHTKTTLWRQSVNIYITESKRIKCIKICLNNLQYWIQLHLYKWPLSMVWFEHINFVLQKDLKQVLTTYKTFSSYEQSD